jgi:hypothetical protein
MLENRVLRRIFGPKRNEVTGEWRKLHNEELHYLYSSPNIVWVIKSRRMRLQAYTKRIGIQKLPPALQNPVVAPCLHFANRIFSQILIVNIYLFKQQ